jgi:hypothetical protein
MARPEDEHGPALTISRDPATALKGFTRPCNGAEMPLERAAAREPASRLTVSARGKLARRVFAGRLTVSRRPGQGLRTTFQAEPSQRSTTACTAASLPVVPAVHALVTDVAATGTRSAFMPGLGSPTRRCRLTSGDRAGSP